MTSPFDNVRFPPLSSLPYRKGDPPGAIWGFYEHVSQSSKPDELGSLNLLTPTRILNAAREEIRVGKVCSLNWATHKPVPAGFRRRNFERRVFKWDIPGKHIVDDEIHMNTQSGSQWDGFNHWAYYKTGQFYNGLNVEDVVGKDGNGLPLSPDYPIRNGIHGFQGKIVGRGVLLDYFSYAQDKGITYQPNQQHLIEAATLDECAKQQGVTFQQGDILFVRMGYVPWYEGASDAERITTLKADTKSVGIKQGTEEVQWLWDHHFAAVAADSPAFEARPTIQEWNLHDYLLALWGTPIGELFDLEDLAITCKELNRYSFFVTSSPMNTINGIASPPNAMAIF